MLHSSIKCSYANFEYLLLQIHHKANMEQIEAKLTNFKKLEQTDRVIVLEFAHSFSLDEIGKMVLDIHDLISDGGVVLHSILKNDILNVDNVFGVPVIDFPVNSKAAHIYNKTLTFSEPVRSGIRLENDGDIIVTNFVSDNAEIVATGNIHVYGVARGRLIAGSSGDKTAQIFVSQFNAELISIGGVFRVIENRLPINVLNKAVMISLDDKDHLNVTLL